MIIEWGPIDEDGVDGHQTSEIDQDQEYGRLLIHGAKTFCETWDIALPPIRLIQGRGSCYSFRDRTVYLNIDRTDQQGRGAAPENMGQKDAENSAALICLCHELTHAVQDIFLGRDLILANKVLMEAHADAFAAFHLANFVQEGTGKLVADIAFQIGGDQRLATHPPGCIRKRVVEEGLATGAGNLYVFGDTKDQHSTRKQLFEDSLQTAVRNLFFVKRVCLIAENWTQVDEKPCSTCPNRARYEERVAAAEAAWAKIGGNAIKRIGE